MRNIRLERWARRYPSLFPFGTEVFGFLTKEQEQTAPFDERLRSCWRYLAGRARRYAETFSPRERAAYDAEDLIHEIVAALIERDGYWDWRRGRYSTFAERVVRSVLGRKREQARVVHAPQSAMAQLSRAHALERAGATIGQARRATLKKVARTFGPIEVCSPGLLAPEHPEPPPPPWELVEAIKGFNSPLQALVLARSNGLFGSPVHTTAEIAHQLGIDPSRVNRIQGVARRFLRSRITALDPSLCQERKR